MQRPFTGNVLDECKDGTFAAADRLRRMRIRNTLINIVLLSISMETVTHAPTFYAHLLRQRNTTCDTRAHSAGSSHHANTMRCAACR